MPCIVIPNKECLVKVAVHPIKVGGDVNIADVPVLELVLVRNPVADDLGIGPGLVMIYDQKAYGY